MRHGRTLLAAALAAAALGAPARAQERGGRDKDREKPAAPAPAVDAAEEESQNDFARIEEERRAAEAAVHAQFEKDLVALRASMDAKGRPEKFTEKREELEGERDAKLVRIHRDAADRRANQVRKRARDGGKLGPAAEQIERLDAQRATRVAARNTEYEQELAAFNANPQEGESQRDVDRRRERIKARRDADLVRIEAQFADRRIRVLARLGKFTIDESEDGETPGGPGKDGDGRERGGHHGDGRKKDDK